MNKRLLIFICAVAYVSSCFSAEFVRPRNPMTLVGTIQFPSSIKKVPEMRIYRCGNIINCELDPISKRLSFSFMDDRSQMYFAVLITESIAFETDDNTVKYIKIDPKQPYKLFMLTLKETTSDDPAKAPHYSWDIKPMAVSPVDGRIPDSTVIICYNPAFVAQLRGGNSVELPTIVIKPDILAMVGSEVNLHEQSAELLLSSIDYDMLHSHIKQEVKQDYANKTVITLTT